MEKEIQKMIDRLKWYDEMPTKARLIEILEGWQKQLCIELEEVRFETRDSCQRRFDEV